MTRLWLRDASGEMSDCYYCLWWDYRKRRCSRETGYIFQEEIEILAELEKKKKSTVCYGCPYGRVYTCVGWCTRNLLGGEGVKV